MLMTYHYPDLGSACDWLNQISQAARPIRSTTHVWVVTRHQYGISALVSQTSFGGKPVGASPNVGCFLGLTLAKLTATKDGPSRILSSTITYNENKDHLALNS